jgi:putative oxidoreductase
MRMAFLARYREAGLLLLRVTLGLLFIYVTAPVLTGGAKSWAHFGAGIRLLGIHSHFQFWGILHALAGCVGGILMIFGLFFRIGVLLALVLTILQTLAIYKSLGVQTALPVIQMCLVLTSLLFIGPGKFSVDKT